MTVLVAAAELLAADRPHPVLLDVRWALGDARGRERYLEGHLPDAVFVDLETELADAPSPAAGRHPLPSVQRLQAAARRWGIRKGDAVVAYDATGGLAAARAWWLLRWGGLTDVRLLDGGLDAWRRAGGPLESGDVVPEPGTCPARSSSTWTPSWPTRPRRRPAGTRCRRCSDCRPPPAGGASAAATASSPTTTPVGWPRRAPGGCCGGAG